MPKTNPPYAAVFKRSRHPPAPVIVPPGHVLFRLLCHSSRVGGVIGKSGAIIKQLQHDTAARIRVEESPHGGADDRVIVIVASSSVNRRIALEEEEEESEVSSAQEAVVRVFERIVDVAADVDDGISMAGGGVVSCRLLAENGQAGAVIGKGGKVVMKIKKNTGCKVRVLSSDKSPPSDEVVEIEGNILAVKRALVAVSLCLQDCPPVDGVKAAGIRLGGVIPQEPLQDLCVDLPQTISVLPSFPAGSFIYASGCHPVLRESERALALELRSQLHEVVFTLLCTSDRVGSVIGKGGTIVRALENETGASIIIGGLVSECDERLITVSAMENPESRYSPAQNAVVLVFSRYIEAGAGKGLDLGSRKGLPVSARLVVPSNHVGCLLGKGGTVVSEMRKSTGAYIRIFGNDQAPKCVTNNADIVQITGEFVNVRDALSKVTSRLRDDLFYSRISNGGATRSNASVITESSPFGRANDPSSLGRHTSVVSHNLNRQSITYSMDKLGLSHHNDRPPSPRLWVSQTVAEMNSRSVVDVGRGQSSIKSCLELGSGGRSAIVRATTVEIVVSEDIIGSVYGENGSNLARLRQISGAKVVVHEPHPGTADRMVVISGTPDETQAAQSLLQAFILTGSS